MTALLLRVVALTMRPSVSEMGWCDACSDVGLANPAVADRHLAGGVWVSLCTSHAHRYDSAERARLVLASDPELAAVAALVLDSLPRPTPVPDYDAECARAALDSGATTGFHASTEGAAGETWRAT